MSGEHSLVLWIGWMSSPQVGLPGEASLAKTGENEKQCGARGQQRVPLLGVSISIVTKEALKLVCLCSNRTGPTGIKCSHCQQVNGC